MMWDFVWFCKIGWAWLNPFGLRGRVRRSKNIKEQKKMRTHEQASEKHWQNSHQSASNQTDRIKAPLFSPIHSHHSHAMWRIESRVSLASPDRVDFYWYWMATGQCFKSYQKAKSCLTALFFWLQEIYTFLVISSEIFWGQGTSEQIFSDIFWKYINIYQYYLTRLQWTNQT